MLFMRKDERENDRGGGGTHGQPLKKFEKLLLPFMFPGSLFECDDHRAIRTTILRFNG